MYKLNNLQCLINEEISTLVNSLATKNWCKSKFVLPPNLSAFLDLKHFQQIAAIFLITDSVLPWTSEGPHMSYLERLSLRLF